MAVEFEHVVTPHPPGPIISFGATISALSGATIAPFLPGSDTYNKLTLTLCVLRQMIRRIDVDSLFSGSGCSNEDELFLLVTLQRLCIISSS